jgi:transmembrane sensor
MSMKDDTQLARWLAGELEGEELETLKQNPRYENLVRIKKHFEKLSAPEFNKEAMLERIVAMEKQTPQAKVIPLYKKAWFQAAAAIVLLLGAGVFFFRSNNFSAPNGEMYAFALPDKSEVILNDGSTVSYSDRNWDTKREVKLEGEAYFKVEKGKTFTVNTPEGIVTVLGTQFNVKAREGRFEVACYEGKVSVMHKKREFILTPNQGIVFTNETDTGVQEVKATEPQWLHEEIVFTAETFKGVVAELERQYDIEVKTSFSSNQLFSGSVPANDIDAALKIISKTYHLKAAKDNNTITLEPADARP